MPGGYTHYHVKLCQHSQLQEGQCARMGKSTKSPHSLLTTGEVARLCGFSPSAVLKWIRAGKLPAYTSPGGQNRVDPKELLGFMRTSGMRIPEELQDESSQSVAVSEDSGETRLGCGERAAEKDSKL